jgi:cilia- and flagella-associated protein 57
MMVVPKFIAGLRVEVQNNIHYLNDNLVLYPAGHNIVIYNTEEKN